MNLQDTWMNQLKSHNFPRKDLILVKRITSTHEKTR